MLEIELGQGRTVANSPLLRPGRGCVVEPLWTPLGCRRFETCAEISAREKERESSSSRVSRQHGVFGRLFCLLKDIVHCQQQV